MRTVSAVLATCVVCLLFVSPSSAVPITVLNPSFEAPLVLTFPEPIAGDFGTTIVDWSVTSGGTWEPTALPYPSGPPDGSRVAYVNGGGHFMELSDSGPNYCCFIPRGSISAPRKRWPAWPPWWRNTLCG